MQILYRTGDLLAAEQTVVVHGCNAAGAFNLGLAKQIRQQMPFAYHAYRDAFKRGLRLGEVVWAASTTPVMRIVGNAITQQNFGRDGRRYVDYDAVRQIIREVDRFVVATQDGTIDMDRLGWADAVAFPRIGSGLAGGDWAIIAAIIEEESRHFQPIVYSPP